MAPSDGPFPIPPITSEELLDESNTQPARLVPIVRDVRSAVRDALSSQGVVATAMSLEDGVAAVDRETRLWLSKQTVFIEPADTRWIRARVIDDLTGAGPIEPLRRDARTTEVIVFAPRAELIVAPDGSGKFAGGTSVEFSRPVGGVSGLRPAPGVVFDDDDHVLDVVSWLAGKRPTLTGPRISATLSDGSRMQAVHGDVATGHTTLALRRHPKHAHTICDLVGWGALPMEMARDLAWFVKNRFTMVVSGSTSSGKRLAVDTPILTADRGWTTMGELRVGDRVFGDDGLPANVSYVSPVGRGKTYRLTFSDGAQIVADAEHLWATTDLDGASRVRETEEIVATLFVDGTANHTVPQTLGFTVSINGDSQTFPERAPRGIVAAEEIEPVDMLCIQVDNESHLYLAGRELIPTHNTTLLNALLPFVNPSHHLFIVEDTKEIIHPPYLQVSRRVARLPKGDAEGVSIRDHVKDALRFRPDIICIGELRDAAALEAMKAYNTGHEGSATTCHANDAGNTIKRLAAMMTESPDMPDFDLAKDLVASAVDIVVFVKKYPDGVRRVTEVAEVEKPTRNATGLMVNPTVTPLWTFDEETGFTRHRSPSLALFEARSVAYTEECPVTEQDVVVVCDAMRQAAGLDQG